MSNQHTYAMHCDGLSTFINLAGTVLHERQSKGELSPAEAQQLQGQANLSMQGFGLMFEALAFERMDSNQDDDHATSTALLLAGRMLREMAGIHETLATAMAKPKKPTALQAA